MTTDYDIADTPDTFARVPPSSLEAEQCILGGMTMTRQAIIDAIDELDGVESPFYRPAHETIYRTILGLYARNEPVDPITLTAALKKSGDLDRVGGPPYIHQCVDSIPTAANTGYYARIVRNLAMLRRVVETGTELAQMGYDARHDPDQAAEVLDAAAAKLQALTASFGTKSDTREWKLDRILEHVLNEYEHPSNNALPLPWKDLQDSVPMEPGDLVVVGARPGVGKTVVIMDVARHVAIKHGRGVLVASMEMSHLQIGQRLIAAEATAGLHHIRNRNLEDHTKKKMEKRIGRSSARHCGSTTGRGARCRAGGPGCGSCRHRTSCPPR